MTEHRSCYDRQTTGAQPLFQPATHPKEMMNRVKPCGIERRRRQSGRHARQDGFSLIEIMVVVVIMGIMAGLIVPNLLRRPDQARAVTARQDISSLSQALKLYRLDNGHYPSAVEGLQALVQQPVDEKLPGWHSYLDRLPADPWGHPYQYLNPGVKGEIDVFSLGADNKPGGTDSDADIGSWSL
jgi:general secretion pathway protein G